MRILLASAVLAAALPCAAGGIDMGLTNPAAPAAPAPQQQQQGGAGLKQIDAALAQAAAGAKELEGVLEAAVDTMKANPKGFVADYRKMYLQKLDTDCRASFQATDVAAAAADSMLLVPVSRFLACQAAAAKGTAVCVVPSDPKVKDENAQGNCIDAFTLARFADAVATGGDAAGACKQGHAARGGTGDATAACKAVAAGSCDATGLAVRPFDDKPHCQAVLAAIRGEAGACARAKKYDGSQAYTCADMAAIRAARKGGSCGSSALCQAYVTGKADACVPLLAAVKKGHCEAVVRARADRDALLIDAAAKEFREKNPPANVAAMEAVTAKRKAVDAQLVALGAALDGFEPKTDPQFASRPARYREIRRKVDAALKRFKLATEAPAPAKAAKP
jgi:hypothetical protein